MAKRKKQDKIIAKLRRELQVARQELKKTREEISLLKGEKSKQAVTAKIVKKSPLKERKQALKKDEKLWEYPPLLIKKDLWKTLTLSTLAILFELVLYWLKLPN